MSDLIHDLLHVWNGLGQLGGLNAGSGGLHAPLQREHSILGVIADVLLIQTVVDERRVVVLLNGVINLGVRRPRFRFQAHRLHADLIHHCTAGGGRLSHAGSLRLRFFRMNFSAQGNGVLIFVFAYADVGQLSLSERRLHRIFTRNPGAAAGKAKRQHQEWRHDHNFLRHFFSPVF